MGTVVSLLEYRYAKLYREQLARWCSRGLRLPACHQIAAHLCRDEFLGRLKSADMRALNARLSKEPPHSVSFPLGLEEAS